LELRFFLLFITPFEVWMRGKGRRGKFILKCSQKTSSSEPLEIPRRRCKDSKPYSERIRWQNVEWLHLC
jgi:hypothetical protein